VDLEFLEVSMKEKKKKKSVNPVFAHFFSSCSPSVKSFLKFQISRTINCIGKLGLYREKDGKWQKGNF